MDGLGWLGRRKRSRRSGHGRRIQLRLRNRRLVRDEEERKHGDEALEKQRKRHEHENLAVSSRGCHQRKIRVGGEIARPGAIICPLALDIVPKPLWLAVILLSKPADPVDLGAALLVHEDFAR